MDDVIKRFRDGDQSAFEELFKAFFSAGRRFVNSFISDDQAADDILQEVFISIWNKRNIFNSDTHFKAYFYKSLRNNTIKRITRGRQAQDLTTALFKESDDVFSLITQIEFNREITRAVSQLPEKRRQIILLSMSGLSAEQISEALKISVNTVKSQKTKAYASLRNELKDIGAFLFLLGL